MERQPLPLEHDERDTHNIIEWPEPKLIYMNTKYQKLFNSSELMERQKEQVERILGRCIFELYSRGQDRAKEELVFEEQIKG